MRQIEKRSNIVLGVMQNGGMDTDLNPVAAALAEISDAELEALIAATKGVPQIAPELDP